MKTFGKVIQGLVAVAAIGTLVGYLTNKVVWATREKKTIQDVGNDVRQDIRNTVNRVKETLKKQ